MVVIVRRKADGKNVAIAEVENVIFKDSEFVVGNTSFNSLFYCVEAVENGKERE